jgi:hypothetical protein
MYETRFIKGSNDNAGRRNHGQGAGSKHLAPSFAPREAQAQTRRQMRLQQGAPGQQD